MINLIPPAYATRIKFGRSNATLRNWILGAVAAIAGLLLIMAGGWLYLNSQASDLRGQLNETNNQLSAQNLDKVKKDATEINGDIKAINQIFKSEIRFSDLIQDIGRITPSGAILSSLTLTQINGPLDLTVNTTDYATAAQVAVNLNDPTNGIFSKADIVSITCNNTKSSYLCTGIYKALFSASAQKKYQNVPGDNS